MNDRRVSQRLSIAGSAFPSEEAGDELQSEPASRSLYPALLTCKHLTFLQAEGPSPGETRPGELVPGLTQQCERGRGRKWWWSMESCGD